MSKTIQVRVDEQLKESSDQLFGSLGLDTSTAIRMFLVAANNSGGIPFAIQNSQFNDIATDLAIRDGIARRETGERFYTAEESLGRLREAIEVGGIRG